jgi:hypothetical protein
MAVTVIKNGGAKHGKCLRFWDAIERDGNFCGVSNNTMKRYLDYLDFIGELCSMGLDREECFTYFKTTTFQRVGLRAYRRDSPLRKNLVEKIVSSITNRDPITIAETIRMGICNLSESAAKENLTPLGHNAYRSSVVRKQKVLDSVNLPPEHQPAFIYGSYGSSSVKGRRSRVASVATTGQWNVLLAMVNAGYAEDEYGAFCIAIKWAAERLENEKNTTLGGL